MSATTSLLERYRGLVDGADLCVLEQYARVLRGRRLVMVNSTAVGGGVAEILRRMVELLRALDVDVEWEVMGGDEAFFEVTKAIHNGLHGRHVELTREMREAYARRTEIEARRLKLDGDIIMIHDPQPAGLAALRRRPGQTWVWRCHIDLSGPDPEVWRFLEPEVLRHDATIFSASEFVQRLAVPSYLAPPSIDPFADKNRELSAEEMEGALKRLGLNLRTPMISQVSRFDRLKDPIGVVQAFARVRRKTKAQLVLVGGSADDDPEGAAVLEETREAARNVPDVTILDLPNDSNVEINAIQRASAVVLQKSLREGFALTVSEALWKERAVVASAVGGIPLQVLHGRTGMLVHSVEGAAYQVLRLLENAGLRRRLGIAGRKHVLRRFLLPRETRDYLAVAISALARRVEVPGVTFDGVAGASVGASPGGASS